MLLWGSVRPERDRLFAGSGRSRTVEIDLQAGNGAAVGDGEPPHLAHLGIQPERVASEAGRYRRCRAGSWPRASTPVGACGIRCALVHEAPDRTRSGRGHRTASPYRCCRPSGSHRRVLPAPAHRSWCPAADRTPRCQCRQDAPCGSARAWPRCRRDPRRDNRTG